MTVKLTNITNNFFNKAYIKSKIYVSLCRHSVFITITYIKWNQTKPMYL